LVIDYIQLDRRVVCWDTLYKGGAKAAKKGMTGKEDLVIKRGEEEIRWTSRRDIKVLI